MNKTNRIDITNETPLEGIMVSDKARIQYRALLKHNLLKLMAMHDRTPKQYETCQAYLKELTHANIGMEEDIEKYILCNLPITKRYKQ